MYYTNTDCEMKTELYNTFRKFWEQHITWTRFYIISSLSDSDDLELLTQRLLHSPKEFSRILNKYYSLEKSKKFETLLTDHLLITTDLVRNSKASNNRDVYSDRIKWYQNADNLADFITSLNPNWSKKEWQHMLYAYLRMTENQLRYRINSQYAADISQFGEIENHVLMMADYMAGGIIKQFNL